MKTNQPTVFPFLIALALAGNAWAASPYDLPYGVQWSFLNGNANGDAPNVATLSPDGTIWIATGGTGGVGASPMLAWGSPKSVYGGSSAAGYGQLNRLGGIIQCNDIPNVNGISVFTQSPNTIVRFSGANPTAYIGGAPNSAMRWTNAVPPDVAGGATHPFTFPVNSGLNQTGFEPYGGLKNGPGDPLDTTLPRKNVIDVAKKFTHNLVSVDSYGGSAFDFQMASDGSYFFCRGAQGPTTGQPLTKGDSFTVGDYSGPVNVSYKPAVGKVSADGTTRSGPAHQPECPGRSFFSDIDINESANAGAGRVYVCGNGFQGNGGGPMTYFDADGPGTDFAPVTFTSTTPNTTKGFAVVYNATTWAIDKVVTWESAQGGDQPNDIESTADGGFVLVGGTNGSMAGFTNPAPLTSDAYMEVYNAAGGLAWSFQTQTAFADNFGDVSVDSDGSIYVSGNSNGNPALWKFTSGGTLVWTTIIDNAGTVESQRDHNGNKNAIFYLSSHSRTGGSGLTWPNTIDYVPQGSDDNLLQKLIPGDFNADKFVDFADVQIAGDATKLGPLGVDTYDFNGDGDSTFADTTYMITTIMERLVGDIAQDSIVTDVDNADIGKAIGASGAGTLYLDGDLNWDTVVNGTDITAVATAFTGAKKHGKYTNGTPGATLRYLPISGQVWLLASEAAGTAITSFQLENAAGTFVPANFTGPTGGGFGGSLKEATGSVLADTDLTLAGSGGTDGLISLGTVFPTGMNLAALTAYLKTAVYTGEPGSGQKQFTPVVYNPVEAPNVLTLAPDGVSNVLLSSNLVATFDEPIALTGIGTVALRNLTLGSGSDITINLPDSQVSVTGTTLTINPTDPLAVGTDYAVLINADAIKDVDDDSGFAGILDDTTWTFSTADTIPPTLASTSIVDDKNGGPIAPNGMVIYTLNFNEDMDASTVDAADFGNAGTATYTIGTITETTPGVVTVEVTPTSGGSLQLQVNAGAVLTDAAGNALVTASAIVDNTTITVDVTLPTLIGTDIVDNKSGGPVEVNIMVTYTVTFSEDMDASTVDAADFGNAGDASVTIGTITETTPGVFLVRATPTTTGTLLLQVNALAELKDFVGNALNTGFATVDDTTLTVNPDTTVPAPDPMTWASVPTPTGTSTIAMTATTATDPSGVEYSFECTAGGGHSSGWQSSATYTDTLLSPVTTYSYRVQARDMSPAQNTTGFSSTVSATTYEAGTFSSSATPPTVDGADIANLVTPTGSDKWYGYNPGPSDASPSRGQTFTTGAEATVLKAITYKCSAGNKKAASEATPTIYAVRVGPVSGSAFTVAAGAVCSQTVTNDPGSYMTWTFATPVPLSASTTYAIDVAMPTAGLSWELGIPYLETSGNSYASGQLFYDSGTGTTVINANATQDRVFHLDIGSPTVDYADWSGGAAADIDSNADGVENGVAWALGAANPNANAIGLLPALDNKTDPAYVIFTFNRSDEANADPKTAITVEYGNNLIGWTTAVDDNDNVEIEVTPGSPTDQVLVKLKRSTLGATGNLFARLKVVVTP